MGFYRPVMPYERKHRHRADNQRFIPLGRTFKSYMKRYKSPAMSSGVTQRKKERQVLAKRHLAERRACTARAQLRAEQIKRFNAVCPEVLF